MPNRRNSILPTSNRVNQLLNEWLERCSLVNFNKYESILRYFDANADNEELMNCLITAIDDESYHEKYLEVICKNLFFFYRTKVEKFKLLTLNCLPSLTLLHLTKSIRSWNFFQLSSLSEQTTPTSNKSAKSSISSNLNEKLNKKKDKNIYNSVDTLLLSIYNLEVLNDQGNPVVKQFKAPLLSRPSIYHESLNISSEYNTSQAEIIIFGPHYDYEQINSSNRMHILTVLFEIYNQHLTSLVIESLIAVCNLIIGTLDQNSKNQSSKSNGFQVQTLSSPNEFEENLLKNLSLLGQSSKRINLSSKLMIQLLTSIYFCLFNGVVDLGRRALKLIHSRSTEMMYFDVLLMSNSIMNSTGSMSNITKSDDQMGINVILSPTIKSQTTKKAITNANFKSFVLPEDIPIVKVKE